MNYTEIKALALSYSDRTDTDTADKMDDFLLVAESRINRSLRTLEMSTRATVTMVADQEYYGLPDLFAGMRDVEIRESTSTKGYSCSYLAPVQMNAKTVDDGCYYYTIIADQLQIFPAQDGKVLELVYYKRLTPLSTTDTTNWLSDRYPDVYLFALMTEIESFVKSADSAMLWEQRYKAAITEIETEDQLDRWSGTPMTVKVA